MKNIKLSPLYAFLLIILVIVMLYTYVVYLPLSGKISALNNDNNSLKNRINDIQSDFLNVGKLDQEKADIQKRIDEFENKINFDGNTISILDDINQSSKQYSIKTDEISTGKTTALSTKSAANKNYNILKTTIDISFSGSYNNITNFLKYFEDKNDKFYRVETLSVTPVGLQATNTNFLSVANYSASMKLAVYYDDPTK